MQVILLLAKLHQNETQIGHKLFLLASQDLSNRDSVSRQKNILKRSIPVNSTHSSFDKKGRIIQTDPDQIKTEPRPVYHEFMTLDQGGSAVIASDNTKYVI